MQVAHTTKWTNVGYTRANPAKGEEDGWAKGIEMLISNEKRLSRGDEIEAAVQTNLLRCYNFIRLQREVRVKFPYYKEHWITQPNFPELRRQRRRENAAGPSSHINEDLIFCSAISVEEREKFGRCVLSYKREPWFPFNTWVWPPFPSTDPDMWRDFEEPKGKGWERAYFIYFLMVYEIHGGFSEFNGTGFCSGCSGMSIYLSKQPKVFHMEHTRDDDDPDNDYGDNRVVLKEVRRWQKRGDVDLACINAFSRGNMCIRRALLDVSYPFLT